MDGHPPASPADEPGSPDKVGAESVEEQPAIRRLWWVWSLLALVVLTAGAFAATRSVLLDVDEVLVDGVGDRLDRLLVVEVSGIRTGDPMVDVSSEAAAHRVATLPWVAEAKVVRDWRAQCGSGSWSVRRWSMRWTRQVDGHCWTVRQRSWRLQRFQKLTCRLFGWIGWERRAPGSRGSALCLRQPRRCRPT